MSSNPSMIGDTAQNGEPARFPGQESLNGKFMTLVRLTEEHYYDLWESLGSHPELWELWPDNPPNTLANFNDYLNKFLQMSTDLVIYSIIPNDGANRGKAAGLAFALSENRNTDRISELGLFYGAPLQKTRAGTEAAYVLANHLFELNHRRLGWKTNASNLQSRKTAERFGFVYEGTLRQHQVSKGKNRDTAWYSIIDSEWTLCKKALEIWLEDGNFDDQGRQIRSLKEIRDAEVVSRSN